MKRVLSVILCLSLLFCVVCVSSFSAFAAYQGTYELSVGKSQTVSLSSPYPPSTARWSLQSSSMSKYISIDNQSLTFCRVTAKDYYYGGSITLMCDYSYSYTDPYTGKYRYTTDIATFTLVIERPVFTVTFDPAGGSVSPSSKQVSHSDSIGTLPNPNRSGYTFDGWYYSDGAKAKSSDACTKDVTLTARWTQNTAPVTPTNSQGDDPTTPLSDSSEDDFIYRVLPDGTAEIIDYIGSASNVNIPSSLDGYTVTSIGEGSFREYQSIVNLSTPNTVTKICNDAFSGCKALTNITFSSNLKSIGDSAFRECDALISVQLPLGLETIGFSFPYCDSLRSVTIPESVTSIKSGAFRGCKSLTGAVVQCACEEINFFEDCVSLRTVILSNGTMKIGYSAFSNCNNLKSITVPDSVTNIGNSAFMECCSLESVTLGKSLKSIESYAFYGCTNLKSITIPASVTEIKELALGYYFLQSSSTGHGKVNGFTISGYNGTAAQTYAAKNGFKFISLGEKPTEPEKLSLLGDADGDGAVSVIDATTIQKVRASLAVSFFNETASDVDGDKVVSVIDATYIQKHLAHISVPFKIGEPVT